MGKESFIDAHAASPDHEIKQKLRHVELVGAPRTILRTLIARESGSLRSSERKDLAVLNVPAGKRVESGSRRINLLNGAKTGRIGSLVKAGSPTPSSGSPSPKTVGIRMGEVSHKIRVFKKSGLAQSLPQPAERLVQFGGLIAQGHEEMRRVAIEPHVQPLRDFFAAEFASSCATQRVEIQGDDHRVSNTRHLRSSLSQNMEASKPVLTSEESQELRNFFTKDCPLETSEEGEFWDSGSLCGAQIPSWSCHDKLGRRSRFFKHEKVSSSLHFTSEPEIQIVEEQDLHVLSSGRGCCRLSDEIRKAITCDSPKSSLGTLLAEEIATSSGLPLIDSRWSVQVAESTKRVKIGSLSDISAPIRPESQSQLAFLITKILTLRAKSVRGNVELMMTRLPGEDDGGCFTSGSMQTPADVTLGEETCLSGVTDAGTATVTDVSSSIVHVPDILATNSLSSGTKEASSASTQELSTSTSTVLETPLTTSDASGAEIRDDGIEVAISQSRPDSQHTVVTSRVQLGTLLECPWGEHGWLPLGRSWMGSSRPVASQPSSSGTLRCNCEISSREVSSEPSALLSMESALPPEAENIEVTQDVEQIREVIPALARERPSTRVSLLSLLNRDIETNEDGLQADMCGCRDDEDEVVTEELDPMCCVCMVGHKGAAFIPCGHTFCRKCCREVRRSIGSCPLCNQAIVDVLKLY